MAYQKLQVGAALEVTPSDSLEIPVPGGSEFSGTSTTVTDSKLIDSAATFQTDKIKVGDLVYNTRDNTSASVINVVSETELDLSSDAFQGATGATYRLYSPPAGINTGCVLYVGDTGDLQVVTTSGNDVSFKNVPTGSFIPVQVLKVKQTATTADNIVALW